MVRVTRPAALGADGEAPRRSAALGLLLGLRRRAVRGTRVESTGTRPKFTPTSKHPRHQRVRRRERVLVLELALVPLQFLF